MAVGGVWIPVTLLASSAQTLRNAMQRDLIGALGAVGAAQVRFLFGLPFALMFLAGLAATTGLSLPRLTAVNLAWTVFGAVSQVIATATMLAAMRTKSFVVAVAYTKTEAAQIALFGLIALNDPPTRALVTAIALATIGVAPMAIRSRKELMADWRSAALGLFSATFFAFAAIGFRSAVIDVAGPSRVLSASVILVVGLAIQSAVLGLYLAAFDREGARAIIGAWRSSLFAGFMGALASQLWFIAFALSQAAPVRTLALIEVPMAQVVSLKMFREPPSLREGLGMSLIVIAAGILVWTAR
jgi:drug/metabolite transporter (DMT)-like permease